MRLAVTAAGRRGARLPARHFVILGVAMPVTADLPVILITGASGNLGRSLARYLEADYRIVGLDRKGADPGFPMFAVDLASDDSLRGALQVVRQECVGRLAAVTPPVAYLASTG